MPFSVGQEYSTSDLLTTRFSGDSGNEFFARYVEIKANRCRIATELQARVKEGIHTNLSVKIKELLAEFGSNDSARTTNVETLGQIRKLFEDEIRNARSVLSESYSELLDESELTDPLEFAAFFPKWWNEGVYRYWDDETHWDHFYISRYLKDTSSDRSQAFLTNLSFIRRSNAKDAITAVHLFELVNALKRRSVPILCHPIQNGIPEMLRFSGWGKWHRVISKPVKIEDPLVTILGPSVGLVEKHRERIPVGQYLNFCARSSVPIRSISPSNQLSYVLIVSFEGQNVLIAGDSGFVDFGVKPRSRTYNGALLSELKDLQIVQIAHHGGANGHFYRALMDSGLSDSCVPLYFLLSHGPEDPKRPSQEFFSFLNEFGKESPPATLLFTGKPPSCKQADLDLLAKLTHRAIGAPSSSGDVRLKFRASWTVTKHSIQIP